MKDSELQIIEQLTGVSPDQIRLADDGFWSRGYIIDDGRIVFKFKKSPDVSYQTEIKALEFINSLNLGIITQKVGWISPDDSYLGIYGVIGKSLELTPNPDYQNIGQQLASALRKLHQAHPEDAEVITLDDEIAAWQKRYQKSHNELSNYFSEPEISELDHFISEIIPAKLRKLGENIVYSHGDLGDGNIIINGNEVGIIDFSEMCYLDEAADFMDVSSAELRAAMLDAYGANDILREKVHLRVLVRPLFVLDDYIKRGDKARIEQLVHKIKTQILQTPLKFVPESDPILHQKCRKLSPEEIRSAKIRNLIDDLFYTVKNSSRGVGLSANQIGQTEAISVVAIKPTPARPDLQPFNQVYINTEITRTFGEKRPMWEGCLSTAVDENGESAMAPVPRFSKIQIEYLDRDGQKTREIVDGFIAHVLQHETDHLNGVLFTDLIDKSSLISYQEYIKLTKNG